MAAQLARAIWYPSNLPDRITNIVILAAVLILAMAGFDYAKTPAYDFLNQRVSANAQILAVVVLWLAGTVTLWGIAREEYVTIPRSVVPAVLSYLLLALLCSIVWFVRGIFSSSDPYHLEFGAPIEGQDLREVLIGGQLFLLINLGTLYYKKPDGSTVRGFTNSFTQAKKLFHRLFDDLTPNKDRKLIIPSLRAELKSLSGKANTLNATLREEEAKFANDIASASGRLDTALGEATVVTVAQNPAGVLKEQAKPLETFGIRI